MRPHGDDPSFSFSLGVVRRGIAIGIGITLDEAMHMPRRAFDSMVEAKLRYDGSIDWKNRQGRLEDDYLRTLDEITARLKREITDPETVVEEVVNPDKGVDTKDKGDDRNGEDDG